MKNPTDTLAVPRSLAALLDYFVRIALIKKGLISKQWMVNKSSWLENRWSSSEKFSTSVVANLSVGNNHVYWAK